MGKEKIPMLQKFNLDISITQNPLEYSILHLKTRNNPQKTVHSVQSYLLLYLSQIYATL